MLKGGRGEGSPRSKKNTPHFGATELDLRKVSFRPGLGPVKLRAKLWAQTASLLWHRLFSPNQRTLDPRLRRLLSSKLDVDCIAADMRAGYLWCIGPVEERKERNKDNTYARVLVKLSSIPDWEELKKASHIWRKPVHIAGSYYTVDIRLSHLDVVAAHPAVQYMETARLVSPALETPVLAKQARGGGPAIQTQLDGTGVVIGIVDYGINYLLKDFQDKHGKTRIAYLWDQELRPKRGERSPEPYGYGVEYEAAAIDRAVERAAVRNRARNGWYDRDAFRIVRHRPNEKSNVGRHGTHVAGIAAGRRRTPDGENVGVAPGATIVFVHMSRKQILEEVEARGTSLADSVQLAEAIAYCFEKAGDRPCVVNLSMGFNGGGHDGHSPIEEIIDALLEDKARRAVVIAAGNQHGQGIHCSGTLKRGHTHTLKWDIGELEEFLEERDPTLNEMEIWYSSKDRCRVRLVDPENKSTPPVAVGDEWSTDFGSEVSPFPEAVFIQSEGSTALNPEAARIYIRVAPPRPRAGIRPGVWRVELEADVVKSDERRFDAWIEKEADNSGQSKFANATKTATLTTPATAHRAITVANYICKAHKKQRVASDSGRGPTRDRQRGEPKPDLAAPGTDILSSNAFFRLVPGERKALAKDSGTSMAAPYVAGVIALLLQRARQEGVDLSAKDIKRILTESARRPRSLRAGKHHPAWGYGKVDAQAAIRELERNFL